MPSQDDWDKCEAEYRANQLTVSELGRLFSVSHTAIQKRAKKFGWTRDLAAKVAREVQERLVQEGVQATNAREIVEKAAERDIQIIRQHRKDISAGRAAVSDLFAELVEAGKHRAEIEQAVIEETKGEQGGNRRSRMLQAVSLSSRANVASNLSMALKNIVTIERQAFGLKNESPDGQQSGDGVTKIVFVDAGNSGS